MNQAGQTQIPSSEGEQVADPNLNNPAAVGDVIDAGGETDPHAAVPDNLPPLNRSGNPNANPGTQQTQDPPPQGQQGQQTDPPPQGQQTADPSQQNGVPGTVDPNALIVLMTQLQNEVATLKAGQGQQAPPAEEQTPEFSLDSVAPEEEASYNEAMASPTAMRDLIRKEIGKAVQSAMEFSLKHIPSIASRQTGALLAERDAIDDYYAATPEFQVNPKLTTYVFQSVRSKNPNMPTPQQLELTKQELIAFGVNAAQLQTQEGQQTDQNGQQTQGQQTQVGNPGQQQTQGAVHQFGAPAHTGRRTPLRTQRHSLGEEIDATIRAS